MLNTIITVVKNDAVNQKALEYAQETSLNTVRYSLDRTLAIFKWSEENDITDGEVALNSIVWQGLIADFYVYEEQNKEIWIAPEPHSEDGE